jgi:hypothetical protein
MVADKTTLPKFRRSGPVFLVEKYDFHREFRRAAVSAKNRPRAELRAKSASEIVSCNTCFDRLIVLKKSAVRAGMRQNNRLQ